MRRLTKTLGVFRAAVNAQHKNRSNSYIYRLYDKLFWHKRKLGHVSQSRKNGSAKTCFKVETMRTLL